MASYPKHVWNQVKNTTCKELISALKRDGFERDMEDSNSGMLVYRRANDGRRVTVHWKPRKTHGASLLKSLFEDAGWTTEEDLRRVELIK